MVEHQPAAVRLDDGAADVEAQPEAAGLGGEEGREHLLGERVVDARAAVEHADLHAALDHLGLELDHAPFGRRGLHRLQAVGQQVQQHLLEQHAVAAHRRQRGRDAHLGARLALPHLALQQRERIGRQRRHRAVFRARGALAHEAADAPHDLGAAPCLRHGFVEAAGQQRLVALFGEGLGRAREAAQRHQRLVELVGAA